MSAPTRAEAVDEGRPALPKAIAGLILGAIAVASLAALVWPSLTGRELATGPTAVGVIRQNLPDAAAAGRIGAAAPNFEWNAPDGKTARLSDLRGKVVVLNFWATWCAPCRTEMPALNDVARGSDAVFLAVDLQEDGAKARSFLDQLALDRLTPILDTDGATTRAYGVFSLPMTFFVDAQGVIRHIEHGQILDADAVRRGIAKAR